MKHALRTALVVASVGGALAAMAAPPVKLGVSLPLSGNLAAYGKTTLEGVKLRTSQINAAGGVNGAPLQLVIEDNKGDATESVNVFNKLAGTDKVVAVVGPITSTNALACRRAAKELKVPLVSPTATNDKVTLKNGYVFRACFNDSFQGRIVATHAARNLGHLKAAVFVDLNSDYSKGLAASFAKAFAAAGGTIVAEESYQQKDTEFGPALKKIKDSGAQIIFVPGYPPEVPLIVKQAKVSGITARLCGADGWDNEAVLTGAGPNLEGCFLVGAFSREDQRPAARQFLDAFAKQGQAKPGTFEALGYDTVSLIAEALKSGATPDAVRRGLLGIKDFEAVTGRITISPDGDAIKSAVILDIVRAGDRFTTKYQATVNP